MSVHQKNVRFLSQLYRSCMGSSNKYIRYYSTSLNYAIAPDKQRYPLEGVRVLDLTRIGE